MDDDLRNMVWRGHYLGWGPADVLLHVPVERPLMAANPKVRIVAPYFRERLAVAYRRDALPRLDSLAALRGVRVAVAGQSLAGCWCRRWRAARQLLALGDGVAAATALRDDEVTARPAPVGAGIGPRARRRRHGAAAGAALTARRLGHGRVKQDAVDLAETLQQAMQSCRLVAPHGDFRARRRALACLNTRVRHARFQRRHHRAAGHGAGSSNCLSPVE
jgi:hypothetical protein